MTYRGWSTTINESARSLTKASRSTSGARHASRNASCHLSFSAMPEAGRRSESKFTKKIITTKGRSICIRTNKVISRNKATQWNGWWMSNRWRVWRRRSTIFYSTIVGTGVSCFWRSANWSWRSRILIMRRAGHHSRLFCRKKSVKWTWMRLICLSKRKGSLAVRLRR